MEKGHCMLKSLFIVSGTPSPIIGFRNPEILVTIPRRPHPFQRRLTKQSVEGMEGDDETFWSHRFAGRTTHSEYAPLRAESVETGDRAARSALAATPSKLEWIHISTHLAWGACQQCQPLNSNITPPNNASGRGMGRFLSTIQIFRHP